MHRSWQKAVVPPQGEHIVVSYGDSYVHVARVARGAAPGTFLVEFLVDPNGKKSRSIAQKVHTELDFFLVHKQEHDPWAYAIYHCSSAGNLYGDIHWAYYPNGSRAAKLDTILEASRLTVCDRWSGMSPAAPIALHAELIRDIGKGLSGPVSLSIGYEESTKTDQLDAKISEKVTRTLLALLVHVPTRAGKYEPYFSHTDDFPSVELAIETPDGPVVFFTDSQGSDHVPWGLEMDSGEFIVDSAVPAQVLRRLDRYLGRKRLNEMVESFCHHETQD